MKQQARNHAPGVWRVRRRIKIPALSHAADALSMQRSLVELAGVHEVTADLGKRRLNVSYDVTATSFDTIFDTLEQIGFPPQEDWWSRRKMSWYRFTEDNARANAKTAPAACCNKPPDQRHG